MENDGIRDDVNAQNNRVQNKSAKLAIIILVLLVIISSSLAGYFSVQNRDLRNQLSKIIDTNVEESNTSQLSEEAGNKKVWKSDVYCSGGDCLNLELTLDEDMKVGSLENNDERNIMSVSFVDSTTRILRRYITDYEIGNDHTIKEFSMNAYYGKYIDMPIDDFIQQEFKSTEALEKFKDYELEFSVETFGNNIFTSIHQISEYPVGTKYYVMKMENGVILMFSTLDYRAKYIINTLESAIIVPEDERGRITSSLNWLSYLGEIEEFRFKYPPSALVSELEGKDFYGFNVIEQVEITFPEEPFSTELILLSNPMQLYTPSYLQEISENSTFFVPEKLYAENTTYSNYSFWDNENTQGDQPTLNEEGVASEYHFEMLGEDRRYFLIIKTSTTNIVELDDFWKISNTIRLSLKSFIDNNEVLENDQREFYTL